MRFAELVVLACVAASGCKPASVLEASPRRRGQPRALHLRPVADLDPHIEPHCISVAPDGRRWAVTGRYGAAMSEGRAGGVRELHPSGGGGLRALAFDEGVLYGDEIHAWKGGQTRLRGAGLDGNESVVQAAVQHGGSWWATAIQVLGPRVPLQLVIVARGLDRKRSDLRWSTVFEGHGTATIGADGRVAVVMSDGTFAVFHVGKGREPQWGAERNLGGEPYAVAIVPGGYAVLVATRSEEGSGQRYRSVRLHPEGQPPGNWRWSTRLVLLDEDARTQAEVDLDFEGWGAPLPAGRDVLWVVGRGVARIESGEIRSSRRIDAWAQGAVFEDGTLALIHEDTLEIVDENGRSRLSVPSPDGLDFAAVTVARRTLWVATQEHLYVQE
jgi:hypothetical protein